MTQEELVYNFLLENKVITGKIANEALGVTRLPAVIFDMKAAGIPIKDEIVTGETRFGAKCWWKEYRLA